LNSLLVTITRKRVRGVGYRVKLINMALEYGIDRFSVFNTFIDGKEGVVCLIDTPDEIVEIFKQRINAEKPEKAIVEDIKFEDYKYEVPPIERCMQAFQTEHWGKAIPILLNMLDEIKDVKRVVGEESEKTRQYLGVKIDESTKTICNKIDDLRYDLRAYLDERLKKLEEEIKEIKAKIGMS
jgi:acylphosphatase